MTYLVQVWRAGNGVWDTKHRCATKAEAKTAFGILSRTGSKVLRVMAKPSIMDVLDMLHELEHAGLVDVRHVDTEWRWTVREIVK